MLYNYDIPATATRICRSPKFLLNIGLHVRLFVSETETFIYNNYIRELKITRV